MVPTLDVDSAFAFRGKGLSELGVPGSGTSSGAGWGLVGRRLRVATGGARDPYDTYDWVEEAPKRGLTTQWFFLLAAFGSHDKGLPASSPPSRRPDARVSTA